MKNFDMLHPVLHTQKIDLTHGDCASLYDVDGNRYLDFNQICTTLGQNNKHFIKRMTEALNGMTSNKAGLAPAKEKLQKYLMDTTGHKFSYIHLTASGSEATEWAVRTALKQTGKTEVLSFWNSIHGRTYLSASMSGMVQRKTDYGPIAPGVLLAAYPNCSHCPYEKKCEDCNNFCLRFLDNKVKFEGANDVGAVIVEAYQGSGVIPPPKGWLKALQDWAHAHGALFILDEVQSGMGRTGKLYRFEEEGLDPDMLLLGKSIVNGLHMGVILSKDIPKEKYLKALTGGAGDDVLACSAACAVFEELLENGLLEHIDAMGKLMAEKLETLAEKYPSVNEVRSMGLAAAVELDTAEHQKAVQAALRQARVFTSPSVNNCIMFKPPYTVTEEEICLMADALDRCLAQLDK